MGICATKSERIDTGIQLPFLRQVRRFRRDAKAQIIQVDRRVYILQMQMRRNLPILQNHRRLDQTGHPCSRLGVPDIGLDGTHQAFSPRFTPLSQNLPYSSRLDGITHWCSRSMGLCIDDLVRSYLSTVQRLTHQGHLCFTARYGQAFTVTIMVAGRCPDQRIDAVPIRQRPIGTLQNHQTSTLSASIAICGRIKCPGTSSWRKYSCPGLCYGHTRRQ